MDLSTKKLIFVTGKGGVGKSVSAAAIAWREALRGRRVCLVELGNQSFYEPFFQTRGISYEPTEIIRDVHIAILTAENCLKEYVLHFLKVPKLYDLLFQNKIMKTFLNAAPAVSELSILGKLTSDIRGIIKSEYDLYVVDCYSTGHALALLRAPLGLSQTFKSGPLFEQARDIANTLCSPSLTHYVLVTLPEEMPVSETSELYQTLKKEYGAEITLICNKLMIPPLDNKELDGLKSKISNQSLLEFIDYIEFKRHIQSEQLKRLRAFAPQIYGVPQILTRASGQDQVEAFAHSLENPWPSINS